MDRFPTRIQAVLHHDRDTKLPVTSAPLVVRCLERRQPWLPRILESAIGGRLAATALLIDYPSLLRAVRAVDPDAVPDLPALVQRAHSFGGAILAARAYGAWYDADEALGAFNAGLDPVFVPPSGPGMVPSATSLVSDGLALIRGGLIRSLVLSGDERLFPLLAAANAANVDVALLAHGCRLDGPCLRLARKAEPASHYARTLTRAEKYRRQPLPRAAGA